jgi:hypothetical protein
MHVIHNPAAASFRTRLQVVLGSGLDEVALYLALGNA